MNKYVNAVIIFLCMAICIILPGESYQSYLDCFDDNYKVTFFLPSNVSSKEMIAELTETANDNNIQFFKTEKRVKNVFCSELLIYGSPVSFEYLENQYDIHEGEYNSLFLGKTIINFIDINTVTKDFLESNVEYSLIGDYYDMRTFKAALIDKYGGSFPQKEIDDSQKEYKSILLVAWIITIILSVLLNLYETESVKKENFVRVINGEKTHYIVSKKILLFAAVSIVLYSLIYNAVGYINHVGFLHSISKISFIVFLIANLLVFMRMMTYNPQKILSRNNNAQSILSLNYIVKCFSVILTVLVIAANTVTIIECTDYYKQKDFFIDHKNDYYYQNIIINNNPSIDTINEEGAFYSEFESDIFYLCEKYMLNDSDYEIAYEANINAIPYLKTEISELNDVGNDAEILLLYKDGTIISDEDRDFLISSFSAKFNVQEIPYHDNARVIVRQLGYEPITKIAKNPIIVVYNIPISTIWDNKQIGIQIPLINCSVNVDQSEVEKFFNSRNISFANTNAYDYYQYRWELLKRTLFIVIILSVVMIVLELLTIFTIIKLEYTINSEEIAIKKVLGYNIIERFFMLYLIEIILGVISVVVSVIVNHFAKFAPDLYVVLVSIIAIAVNLSVITFELFRSDKKNINKILKGGAL